MKKFIFVILAFLYVMGGAAWVRAESTMEGHHSRKHSSKKHSKKKGKKSKHKKGDGAELESQITDKGVQFNAKADAK